jgi:pimeloyl-ACP methyl ester carboxylesterase
VRKDEHAGPKAAGSQRAAGSPPRTVLRPSDFRPESLQVSDLQMHAVVEGPEDGPLIVMLHGFPEFWYSWRYQIKAFSAAGYRTVAVDQRGYNLTDKRGPYDVFTLAGDVVGLVRTLDHERAVIMGNDWGGVVAWVLGARHRSIVERSIVLNAPRWRALTLLAATLGEESEVEVGLNPKLRPCGLAPALQGALEGREDFCVAWKRQAAVGAP